MRHRERFQMDKVSKFEGKTIKLIKKITQKNILVP